MTLCAFLPVEPGPESMANVSQNYMIILKCLIFTNWMMQLKLVRNLCQIQHFHCQI